MSEFGSIFEICGNEDRKLKYEKYPPKVSPWDVPHSLQATACIRCRHHEGGWCVYRSLWLNKEVLHECYAYTPKTELRWTSAGTTTIVEY